MRLGFVTSVQLGLSCMEAIYDAGASLDLAITLHDQQARAKSGRVYLDGFCTAHGVPLLKVRNFNDGEAAAAIREAAIDWLFVIGWSQIARAELLAAPRLGVLGMHPTLLPEGRGRAAIPWAILKRLERTGVTLFKIDEGVDTGDVLDRVVLPLRADETATRLYQRVEQAHIALISQAVPRLLAGTLTLVQQDETKATEWPGRKPEDGAIDLAGSVHDAERLVRAVTHPYPGAFAPWRGGMITVWRATIAARDEVCGDDPCLEFSDGRLRCLEWEPREAQ